MQVHGYGRENFSQENCDREKDVAPFLVALAAASPPPSAAPEPSPTPEPDVIVIDDDDDDDDDVAIVETGEVSSESPTLKREPSTHQRLELEISAQLVNTEPGKDLLTDLSEAGPNRNEASGVEMTERADATNPNSELVPTLLENTIRDYLLLC